MYVILIVEDEKIERESLCTLISDSSLPILKVISARNGEEGLQKYYQYKPDIILADINMPLLGGLDMIEIIRRKDKHVACLVLTSYDYFSYAQKAIHLGVEDFILKPATKETIYTSLIKVTEYLQKHKNTYNQTSSLVQKMEEMKKVLKSTCFYSILTKQKELDLLENFRRANISADSCTCIVFDKSDRKSIDYRSFENKDNIDEINHKNNERETILLQAFIKELDDLGYTIVQGEIQDHFILFVISNRKLNSEDIFVFKELIRKNRLDALPSVIGSIQEELSMFYQSYEDARHILNSMQEQGEENDIKDNELDLFANNWGEKLLDNLEDSKGVIYEFCHEILRFDKEKVNRIVSLMVDYLIIEVDKKFQIKFEKEELEIAEINYEDYQSLEIGVDQLLNKILKPLKSIKYQNNSHIIKKAMYFIEKNYAKPISLNILAEEMNVSPFYLSKLFNKELKKNFTDIVNDLRIKEAKKLIRKNYSIKEVAYKVGFASQSYFTKIFKKKVALSPKEYQNLFP